MTDPLDDDQQPDESGDIEPTTGHGPARGYSRPPFQPGNDLGVQFEAGNLAAMTHGAYSPRRVDPLAEHLANMVLAEAQPGTPTAYLAEASYRPALWAWARAEARVQLLTEWLEDHGGELLDDGEVKGAAGHLRRWETTAARMRTDLGLTPMSRARLGRDVAAGQVDVARLMAELAKEDAERERAEADVIDVDPEEGDRDD